MKLDEAKNYIEEFTIKFANSIGFYDILIKFNKRKVRTWGTCYSNKKIEYSEKFIEANRNNKQVLEWLAIHECCHLEHPNHGIHFRKMCRDNGMPHYRVAKCPGVINPIPNIYYLYECPNCNYQVKNLRRYMKNCACKDCCVAHNDGDYTSRFRFKFKKMVKNGGNKNGKTKT